MEESGLMAWLLRDGKVLASLEVLEGFAARSKGLVGRSALDGAVLLRNTRGVHSLGVRFPLDVAFLDPELVVLRTILLRPYLFAGPNLKARCVLEAEAGAFARWSLKAGDRLEIKE